MSVLPPFFLDTDKAIVDNACRMRMIDVIFRLRSNADAVLNNAADLAKKMLQSHGQQSDFGFSGSFLGKL